MIDDLELLIADMAREEVYRRARRSACDRSPRIGGKACFRPVVELLAEGASVSRATRN